MDGRDIGTHVLKDATVKIFLTASAEARAKRRYDELMEKGAEVDFDTVYRELVERDKGDMTRAASPLTQAEDAVLLDTTDMTLEESVAAVLKLVEEKI
jgi:cytidylate kinase